MKKIVLYSLVLWGLFASVHAMKAPLRVVNIFCRQLPAIVKVIDKNQLFTLKPDDIFILLEYCKQDLRLCVHIGESLVLRGTISRNFIRELGDYHMSFKDQMLTLRGPVRIQAHTLVREPDDTVISFFFDEYNEAVRKKDGPEHVPDGSEDDDAEISESDEGSSEESAQSD